MKREQFDELRPAQSCSRNRLRLGLHDILDDSGKRVGVGFTVAAELPGGKQVFVNVHPAEVDELVRMLMVAKRRRKERLDT